ncbi:hypothetical protein ACH5RR_010523 [Cinchona calisaya]|uniref:Uncharacterized protein n=1 Tax=Cinchona calisaya TaxID=153742 RepID=A0ABD3AJ76_9GENT
MGCFLGCFGGSKDRKRRKQRNKVIPRDQQLRHGASNSLQKTLSTEQPIKESPFTNLVPGLSDNSEEQLSQLSSSPRKRVTFNSNVTTHKHVSVVESVEFLPESEEIREKENEEILVKTSKSSESGDDSVSSSVGSYPLNHRYQNCRDSDDEAEEFGDGNLEDDDHEEDYNDYDDCVDDRIIGQEVWCESVVNDAALESRIDKLSDQAILVEVESPTEMSFLPNQEVKTLGLNRNARNRSDYVHPVLNPVENLTQWKTVKSKGTLQLKPQKENFTAELEAPHMPFSSGPTFKQSSSSLKPKPDRYKCSNVEVAVDASLSTWLGGPESTPAKTTFGSLETVTCERASIVSQGSNSMISLEDRLILGALTVEELKQLSASSLSRRSPSRSPDEIPIIGTVGTYWNDSVSSKDSRSTSSFKGIPNTTSKYREDKRVNWHSTPFETRLERALNRGTGEA